MFPEQYQNLTRMAKRDEREKILGIIEYVISLMGDDPYELYTKKKLEEVIKIIEKNDTTRHIIT